MTEPHNPVLLRKAIAGIFGVVESAVVVRAERDGQVDMSHGDASLTFDMLDALSDMVGTDQISVFYRTERYYSTLTGSDPSEMTIVWGERAKDRSL